MRSPAASATLDAAEAVRSRRDRCMDDRRAPDLEAMDERQAQRFLTELASDLSPEGEYRTRHPEDYVMVMSQSGERFRQGAREHEGLPRGFHGALGPPSIQ